MKRKVEIIAYHGWGMNAHFWDSWDELFDDHVTFKKYDRGYFSEPETPAFSDPEAIRVLFVQGFGMHLVSPSDWYNAHVVVLFSTFNNLKDIMKGGRKVETVVTSLQAEIKNRAYYTLELFWDAMYKADEKLVNIDDFEIRDKELLSGDLDAYYQNLVNSVPIKPKAKVLLYETEYDEISNFTQLQQMKKLFGKVHYYKRFEIVGHAYPFTHAKECFEDLNSHLSIF